MHAVMTTLLASFGVAGFDLPPDRLVRAADGALMVIRWRMESDVDERPIAVEQRLRVTDDGGLEYVVARQSPQTQAFHARLCHLVGARPSAGGETLQRHAERPGWSCVPCQLPLHARLPVPVAGCSPRWETYPGRPLRSGAPAASVSMAPTASLPTLT